MDIDDGILIPLDEFSHPMDKVGDRFIKPDSKKIYVVMTLV
jgi:hypothetical protein